MLTGLHGRYRWLEADHSLREFLARCPTAILGRYIAITAVDSGSFDPSDQDREAGWSASGGMAYSPRLDAMELLAPNCCCRDCCGFDEWYIYPAQPAALGSICHANVFDSEIAPPNVFQFINFGGFQFSNPSMNPITDLFWLQLDWMQPESYVGDGSECLVFVSSNHELFGEVERTLGRSPSLLA